MTSESDDVPGASPAGLLTELKALQETNNNPEITSMNNFNKWLHFGFMNLPLIRGKDNWGCNKNG